jgi:hypothetical protein
MSNYMIPYASCLYLLPVRTNSHGHGPRQTRTLLATKRDDVVILVGAPERETKRTKCRGRLVCLAVDPLLVSGRIVGNL